MLVSYRLADRSSTKDHVDSSNFGHKATRDNDSRGTDTRPEDLPGKGPESSESVDQPTKGALLDVKNRASNDAAQGVGPN
jgi:hypothetical protein